MTWHRERDTRHDARARMAATGDGRDCALPDSRRVYDDEPKPESDVGADRWPHLDPVVG